jgi:hypothetical protein
MARLSTKRFGFKGGLIDARPLASAIGSADEDKISEFISYVRERTEELADLED